MKHLGFLVFERPLHLVVKVFFDLYYSYSTYRKIGAFFVYTRHGLQIRASIRAVVTRESWLLLLLS